MDHHSTNPPNPKKRKSSQISKTNAVYRNLLNTTIHEISHSTTQDPKPLQPSQIGLSKWSSGEKFIFFNAVERLGKHDICGIAEKIGGGKTPLQVREYILLLETGVEELNSGIEIGDIPAAMEISAECCEALDEVAGMVEAEQRGGEEEMEMEKWGEEWLVDFEIAARLEETVVPRSRLRGNDVSERERGGEEDALLKAAELLKPGMFLSLSTHFFMNTSNPLSDNWQSITSQNQNAAETNTKKEPQEEEFPSMRATAFTDFHNLVVQLTRRIVSTALYCAESRLRTTGWAGGRGKKRLIRQRDVRAALEMVGMKLGGREEGWWEDVARRCRVTVLYGNPEKEGNEEIRNGEDPNPLAGQSGDTDQNAGSADEDDSDGESIHGDEEGLEDQILQTRCGEETEQEEDSDSDSASEFEDADASDHNSQHPLSPSSQASSTSPSQKQNAYILALDTYTSHQEESRLWALLNRDPPAHLHLDNRKRPKPPGDGRSRVKRDAEGVNWSLKERNEYWSQWEVMRGVVGEEEFWGVERRKERREEGEDEYESGESDEEERRNGIPDERVGDSDLEDDEQEAEDDEEEGGDQAENDQQDGDGMEQDDDQQEEDYISKPSADEYQMDQVMEDD